MSTFNTCVKCKTYRDYQDLNAKVWHLFSAKQAKKYHAKIVFCEAVLNKYVKESHLETPIQTLEITQPKQSKRFFWQQYSPRCAAITAEDFETIYYLAFPNEQAAIDFVKAIMGKFCKDSSVRSSKRFNSTDYPFEVKVWGMSEAIFLDLVKRDLARN